MKYRKLCEDIKKALQAGIEAENAMKNDGGCCNFDSAAIHLPRWGGKKVEEAAENAGTRAFKWYGLNGYYVFWPKTHGHGNKRSANAEAMTKALRDMGYEAMMYCQMD